MLNLIILSESIFENAVSNANSSGETVQAFAG